MKQDEILEQLEQLAVKLQVTTKTGRYEGKGGMAKVHGEWVLLRDRSMSEESKVDLLVDELSKLDYDNHYLPPVVRDLLDKAARRRADEATTPDTVSTQGEAPCPVPS